MAQKQAKQAISEMKLFASLSPSEQRYICRSLDVAARGVDAMGRWSRGVAEASSIKLQDKLYRTLLVLLRNSMPDDLGLDSTGEIIGTMITLSCFDLGEGKISGFPAYRFLYERLIGPEARPWLPSAFLGAAALPDLHPDVRKALLGSMTAGDVAPAGWSNAAPSFIPEWIDEVDISVSSLR